MAHVNSFELRTLLSAQLATTLSNRTRVPVAANASNGASLAPLTETFKLHSHPTSTKVIYLDFNGQTVSGTLWNTQDNNGRDFTLTGYSFEGDNSFSNNELARIQKIWARVAEDFAPFDVDVTTEEPPLGDLKNTGGNDNRWGVRVIVGSTFAPHADAGGVAYLKSFRWSTDTPALVFENNTGNGDEKSTAEAISHEVGHTLGLEHDGRSSPPEGYYAGHSAGATSWGPIMGLGYHVSLVQWSQGEYTGANNREDDLSIIATNNGFGFRQDDFGSTQLAASDLATTDADPLRIVDQKGVIETRNDYDYFRFDVGNGTVTLDIRGGPVDSNLDILAEVYNSQGELVALSKPINSLNAAISFTASLGTYYLKIDGVGFTDPQGVGYSDYGSLGQYRITGTFMNPNVINNQALPAIKENLPMGTVIGTLVTDAALPGQQYAFSIIGGNLGGAFAINPLTGEISVANPAAIDWEITTQFKLTVQVAVDGQVLRANTATVTMNVIDVTTSVLNNGVLTVKATRFNDQITVSNSGGTILINDGVNVINTGLLAANVTRINLLGLAGDDKLQLDRSLGSNIVCATNGGGGNDLLIGSLGRDTLDGGLGVDEVSYIQATSSVTASLLITVMQNTFGSGWDEFSSIENMTGSEFSDTLTGDEWVNCLDGGLGNDTLNGGAGDDKLDGGLGADLLFGNNGNDTLLFDAEDITVNGGAGIDTASLLNPTAAATLNLFSNLIEIVDASSSTFNNTFVAAGANWGVTITGGSASDRITGGNRNDILSGGGGADVLNGGNGDDVLYFDNLDTIVNGGAGNDAAIVKDAFGAITFNLVSQKIETVNASVSRFDNTFTATGATWAVSIFGGSGKDSIVGGNLNDRLFGAGGDDTIMGNNGNDTLDGGAGIDTVSYATAKAKVKVNLATGTATGGAGKDALVRFENLTGPIFLIGDSSANVPRGGGGIDSIIGNFGADTIL